MKVTETKIQRRFLEIDLMETIAIFFVILYHGTKYSFDFLQSGELSDYLIYFLRTILATCVPIFFFVNGYLLLNKSFDLKKHIKKTVRLFFLTFIWALILMPLYLLIANEPITLSAIYVPILNLSTNHEMNLFWYLGALICIYILFPLIKTTYDNNRKAFIFFIVVIALFTIVFDLANEIVLLLSKFTHVFEDGLEMPIVIMFNPFRGSYGYSFVYFGIGGLMYTLKDKILNIKPIKRNTLAILGIVLNCVCLFIMGVLHSKYIKNELWDIIWNGYDTIFTMCNVICIYTLCLNLKKEFRVIKAISCNTLGIYFIHNLFLNWVKHYAVFALSNIGFSIITALVVLLCCLVISLLMKKIPLIKNLV